MKSSKSINKISAGLFFFFLVLLAGCFGPKKMNKWVASEYGETIDVNRNRSDYITVASPLITNDTHPSTASKRTKSFLPLIFYWKWDYELSGALNPKIPINLFTTTFTNYAGTKGLKQKLNGAKLELTIEKIPVSFSYNDDNKWFFFILFYLHTEKLYYAPQKSELLITYKLTKNNSEIKNGTVNIQDPNKIQKLRFLESAKKAAKEYLEQYDDNVRVMARSALDKLMTEL